MKSPLRSLVVLPTAFADGLAMRGLIASLAASGRQLITITRGSQAALLDPMLLALRLEHTPDHLDAPLSLERREVAPRQLKRLVADEAIVLDRSWWVARARLARIPRRSAPSGPFGLFASRRLPPPREHPAESARSWAGSLELRWREQPTVHVSGAWQRLGRDRLTSAKVDLDAPTVGIYRGTVGGRGGAWPDDRFEALLRQLRRRLPRVQILILATDSRQDLWKSVLLYESTGKIHPVIGPELGDDGLAAVFSHLDLVVAADSLMLHIAAAVGTPTLGLYEHSALRLAPRGEGARFVQKNPLRALEVGDVVERALEILGDS